ncbi:MAG TPA: DUF1553 domain-containing protein, partial [Humisphaera sp.]|nr:DUF1553 domain-containing protein [Humisphaera sp.]
PENRLLWRMNRSRLDFEAMRDSLLAISGELDASAGGKPSDIGGNRRSVYTKIDREFVPGMARIFDFACPDLHIPQRSATTVPQQALFFMNSGFVTSRSAALAARSGSASAADDAGRIERMYEFVFQRKPTESQLRAGLAFVQNTDVSDESTPPDSVAHSSGKKAKVVPARPDPWTEYAHVLLMSNEFLFVD